MGICHSYNQEFGLLKDLVSVNYNKRSYIPLAEREAKIKQALEIIEKYRNLPDTQLFPWYKTYRKFFNRSRGTHNILHHAILCENLEIVLELIKTERFDYYLTQSHQFTYYEEGPPFSDCDHKFGEPYFLIDYFAFQLFDIDLMFRDSYETGNLNFPKYIKKHLDIKKADEIGEHLVEFYAKHKPDALTGISSFYHYCSNIQWKKHTFIMKTNLFTLAHILDLPLTMNAIVKKVTHPKFIMLYNHEFCDPRELRENNTRHVYKRIRIASHNLPHLKRTWQKLIDEGKNKDNLRSLFDATNKIFIQDGTYSPEDALFFVTNFHHIFDMSKKNTYTLIIWKKLVDYIPVRMLPDTLGVQDKITQLLTDEYIAQTHHCYLAYLVPFVFDAENETVLIKMKEMGLIFTQSQYLTMLKKGCCQLAKQMIEIYNDWKHIPDYQKRTALHWALFHRQVDFVKYLLTNYADVKAIDDQGDTPFILACQMKDDSLAKEIYAIEDNKVLLNHRNANGKIAFFYLCENKHHDLMETMVTNSEIPLTMVDLELNSALHYVVKYLTDPSLMIKIIKLFNKEQMMKTNKHGMTAKQILEGRTDLENQKGVLTFWKNHIGI